MAMTRPGGVLAMSEWKGRHDGGVPPRRVEMARTIRPEGVCPPRRIEMETTQSRGVVSRWKTGRTPLAVMERMTR